MSDEHTTPSHHRQPLIYQIRIAGHLGQHWAAQFEGMTLTREDNGDTLLTGLVTDQAALHGLLRRVRDMGVILISVTQVPPNSTDVESSCEPDHLE